MSRLRFADVLLETSQGIQTGLWDSEVIEASMALLGLTEREAQAHQVILRVPNQGFVASIYQHLNLIRLQIH